MAGKRILALVTAALLVVAAIGVRRWIDSGGEVTFGGTPSPVYCDPLVIEACRASYNDRDVIVEVPGRTLDRLLESREDESLLWVTSRIWIDILQSERSRRSLGPLVESVSEPLVSTELLLVSDNDVSQACDAPSWRCLATPGSGLEIGLDHRDTTIGLLAQGQLVAGFFGSQAFAANDLDSSYRRWRASIDDDVTELSVGRSALNELLTVRGKFDVVAASQVEWQRFERPDVEAVSPVDAGPAIVIVVAALGDAGGSTDDLVDALVADGWLAGAPPDRPGPTSGVLEAIRVE